jgi:hypothetical protein
MLKTLTENIKAVLHFGITPVIVVNFVKTLPSEDEIKKAFAKIHDASCLTKADIFMVDNYEDEVYRNMAKDLTYWRILKKVFGEATRNRRRRHGPVPVPVPVPIQEVTKQCVKKGCDNFGKPVDFPRCPFCGGATQVPQPPAAKKCVKNGCENFGKAVDTPRCAFCGQLAQVPQPPAVKQCVKRGCENFGKPVDFPRCPFCGDLTQVPRPPAVKQCNNSDCMKFGEAVDTPRCPFCGGKSDFPSDPAPAKPSIRACTGINCSFYGKEVPAQYPRCPHCGTPIP